VILSYYNASSLPPIGTLEIEDLEGSEVQEF